MSKTWTRAATYGAVFAIAQFSSAVLAQAPSDAQREAIKSQCRNDYVAHCASIPPGGEAALQCLQKNMSNLSAGCAGAVRAVEAPAESTAGAAPPAKDKAPAAANTEPAPAAPADKPATAAPAPAAATAAAKQPNSAQVSAIRSACRTDYPKVCGGVPAGGAAALQCLENNKAKLSSACQQAVAGGGVVPTAAVPAGATPSAATPSTAGTAPAPPALVLRPMQPREELFVARSACAADVRKLCSGVAPGGGRIARCLATNAASLSSACKDVLAQFAAR